MFRRNLQNIFDQAIKRSPVVLLIGPRQSGKSTLMQQLSASQQEYSYVSFDDMVILAAAKSDPMGFIKNLSKPVVLDEVQRVPELFLAIKYDVDQNRHAGRYAVTGSANPLLLPRLGDSLAGRMEILTLFPFSQGELLGKKENFISHAFNNQFPSIPPVIDQRVLYTKVTTGGYPPVQTLDYESRNAWFASYTASLLQKDVADLATITGLIEFPRLLKLLATRASTLFNSAEMSRTSGLATTTLRRYLALLETLFLIRFQSSWFTNRGKRLVKAPKLTIIDTGLLSYLIGAPEHYQDADTLLYGHTLENFVVNELTKQLTWSLQRAELYHCRTQAGAEIDIVLEDPTGNIVGIEVKNSQTVTPADFKGLRYFQELMGSKFKSGIVLYCGPQKISFDDRLHAIPINALWDM